MNSAERNLILTIIELLLEVGVPAAMDVMKNFSISSNPSEEEIRELSDTLKSAKDYWNG